MPEYLEIGCGNKKTEGFLGMDIIKYDCVDIVHDIHDVPWPFKDGQFEMVRAYHVLEHIKPWKFFEVMNEAWRVLQQERLMEIKYPVGIAYELDPTHTIKFHEMSWFYLDPRNNSYKVYKPKPWKVANQFIDHKIQEMTLDLQKLKESE